MANRFKDTTLYNWFLWESPDPQLVAKAGLALRMKVAKGGKTSINWSGMRATSRGFALPVVEPTTQKNGHAWFWRNLDGELMGNATVTASLQKPGEAAQAPAAASRVAEATGSAAQATGSAAEATCSVADDTGSAADATGNVARNALFPACPGLKLIRGMGAIL